MKKFLPAALSAAVTLSMLIFPLSAKAAEAPAGALAKDSTGTIFFVTDNNLRRPFTSLGALQTYGFLSVNQAVITTTYTNFYAIPQGSFIPPRDGSIFCASETKGTDVAGECALITGGKKASFTSAAVFTGLGFSFSRAKYGDSSFLEKTSNIDNTTSPHRPGVLVNYQGTIYLVGSSSLLGIPSPAVFNSWGYSFADAVPANSADGTIPQSGVMIGRAAGQLNPASATLPTATTIGSSDIFSSSAYLKGHVATNGLTANYWFEYGTTTNFGTKTATASIGDDIQGADPFVYISGLTANTKYYFRLVGQNINGTTTGETMNFTTKP